MGTSMNSWSQIELEYLFDQTKDLKHDNISEELVNSLSEKLNKSPQEILTVLSEADHLKEKRKDNSEKSFLVKMLSPKDGVTVMNPDFADYKTTPKKKDVYKQDGVEKIFKDGKKKNRKK